MFQRKALQQLRLWRENPRHKPLVLRGARQVGKSTLVDMFGSEYPTYLKLNLEQREHRAIFESNLSIGEIVDAIYIANNSTKKASPTLLFIDEIQNSPSAVAALRYFFEEVPSIDVVAAGSLLESLIGTHISFPVGRVEYMALRPCSFVEFLEAVGETSIADAICNINLMEPFHERTMRLFKTFTAIGGMPECIDEYSKSQDLIALQPIYETLVNGYRDDVEKYATGKSRQEILRFILQVGWLQAAERIKFEKFSNSNYKSREMSEAFRTLEKTMLLELSYPTTSCELPIIGEQKRSPKLLWLDTGLVNYVGGVQRQVLTDNDLSSTWRGRIGEHIVGQELIANDYIFSHARHFWTNGTGSEAEVDFIFQCNGQIVPIEVKTGHNAKLKSLHYFMDKSESKVAVRVWTNPLSVDDVVAPSGKHFKLINLPFYYVGQLSKFLI